MQPRNQTNRSSHSNFHPQNSADLKRHFEPRDRHHRDRAQPRSQPLEMRPDNDPSFACFAWVILDSAS